MPAHETPAHEMPAYAAPAHAAPAHDAPAHEVLTMGRIGVDLCRQQLGVSLPQACTFAKSLRGSASNVAVAAARLGRRAALINRTGAGPFGEFLHDALRGFGVDDRFVTPTALCARGRAGGTRGRAGVTVFDLDYRPMFWSSREKARRWYALALPYATVAVGNLDEAATAVGVRDPRAATAVAEDAGAAYRQGSNALALPTVQGLVIGRSPLYPPHGTVADAVDRAVGLL
jgi:sugar/nucleoside kinase (ribokinase family)